jgi:hypothetical protein
MTAAIMPAASHRRKLGRLVPTPVGHSPIAVGASTNLTTLTRPAGTALLGPAQLVTAGLPFLLAGTVKTGYDLTLWAWFRRVRLPNPHRP